MYLFIKIAIVMLLAIYSCSSVTETYQGHSSRAVGCPSFTEILQHCSNCGVLIARGFLLNSECSYLSSDPGMPFCSEDVCTFSSLSKRQVFSQKLQVNLLALLRRGRAESCSSVSSSSEKSPTVNK